MEDRGREDRVGSAEEPAPFRARPAGRPFTGRERGEAGRVYGDEGRPWDEARPFDEGNGDARRSGLAYRHETPAGGPTYAPEAPYAPDPRPFPEPAEPADRGKKPLWRRALAPLVALAVLLFKFGAKLKGLLLLLPKLKFATTGLSMLVSIGAYALIWTWKFAVGFVLLLLVHEMGHVLQLRREGIKASAPMFVPFLGAAVMMKELPEDAAAEARVGLAGPVLGTLGVVVPLGLFFGTGDELFRALAYVGFFLNLINLLPVLPLDGGRAMAALTPWMWLVGFAALLALMVFFFSPIMLLVAVFGGIETWRRFKARRSPQGQRFHRVKPRHRAAIAAVYLGLVAVTAIGTSLAFIPKGFGEV